MVGGDGGEDVKGQGEVPRVGGGGAIVEGVGQEDDGGGVGMGEGLAHGEE